MYGEDQKVHGHTDLQGQRRIEGPAGIDLSAATWEEGDHKREKQHGCRCGQDPEAEVVHARQGHVGRADHQRDHPVGKPCGGGHHSTKDHYEGVIGDQVGVQIGLQQLYAGLKQFGADQHGTGAAKKHHGQGKEQVECPDVLVVGAEQPAPPAFGVGMMVCYIMGQS